MKKGKSIKSLTKEYGQDYFEVVEYWVTCHMTTKTVLDAFYKMDREGKREYLCYLMERVNEREEKSAFILSNILRYAELKL